VAVVTRRGSDAVRFRESDGCVSTRWGDGFARSDSWAGCADSRNWHTGRAAVSHTGRRYTRDTVCRVTDAVEVVRAGRAPTPAFVVDCDDGKRVRTTWYAAGEGPVAFR
jgi:hypothetical protein